MLNFDKIYEIHSALKRVYTESDMIAAVFADCPELETFNFSVTSEYDDNNYSDQIQLTAINGRPVDYDAEYEDEDEEGEYGPKVDSATRASLLDLVDLVGDSFGHSDDHLIKRGIFLSKKKKSFVRGKPEIQYAIAHVSGGKIENEWFLNNDSKYAAFYAEDHGRFSKDMEMKLFAGKNMMRCCLMYAQALRKPLPKHLENYWMTRCVLDSLHIDCTEKDVEHFRKYVAFRDGLKKPEKNPAGR
jgi:hypothetical protein